MITLFGHRGAAGEAPENTLAGFAHAVGVGVRAFEFDVRLSVDGELVVFHDDTLARTTGGMGRVEDHSVRALTSLDARHHRQDWPTPAPIPTLAEVLAVFGRMDAYQIEIKPAAPERLPLICQRLHEAIHAARLAERVEVSSFQPEALRAMRETGHRQLAYIGGFDSAAWVERALVLGCTGICPRHTTAAIEVLDSARRHGLRITGWPGHTEADLARLLAWQPDAITTDYPTRAVAFLRNAQHGVGAFGREG